MFEAKVGGNALGSGVHTGNDRSKGRHGNMKERHTVGMLETLFDSLRLFLGLLLLILLDTVVVGASAAATSLFVTRPIDDLALFATVRHTVATTTAAHGGRRLDATHKTRKLVVVVVVVVVDTGCFIRHCALGSLFDTCPKGGHVFGFLH